jgi:probable rRNA maturation factor
VKIAIRGTAPCDLALAKRAMRVAARPYRVPGAAEVTLAFVADAEMRALNKRYRRKDRTTDVLSFGEAMPEGVRGRDATMLLRASPDGAIELGDVVISGAQAARQARRRRWPLTSEIAFLAAHGVLHLLGFDDQTTVGYREMLALGRDAVASADRAERHPRSASGPKSSRTPNR